MNNQEAITLLRNLEDALDSYCELNEEGKNAFRMAITALEQSGRNCSESPNGWIPCSIKKHPDSKIECYVTVKDYTDDYGEEYDLIFDEDTYYPEHDAWDYYCDLDIIAWMPKNEPKEPYQPKEDES